MSKLGSAIEANVACIVIVNINFFFIINLILKKETTFLTSTEDVKTNVFDTTHNGVTAQFSMV